MANVATYSAARIANRINALGREISRACDGRRLDVVVTMDRAFMFAADLIRAIDVPVALHFVREDVRDVQQGGRARREVFFEDRNTVSAVKEHAALQGRDVLLVDAILDSGVTQDFLLRRIGESKPRSLRLAVLLDKTSRRRVSLEPDYFGFQTASNEMWAGYGLAMANGMGSNGKNLAAAVKSAKAARGTRGKRAKKK
jgi:hypoxanthine phosphoribosyltransferase